MVRHVDAGDRAGAAQYVGGQWAALGLVGVDEPLGGQTADGQGELEGQVLGVADAGQHALPAERGVRVGGVTGDQRVAVSIVVGEAAVHGEHRQPLGIADAHAAPAALGEDLPQARQYLALVRRRGVARVVGEHAPQVVAAVVAGHRHHTEQAVGVDPAGGATAVHIPVEVQVGQQPAFGELDTGEPDAGQPPGGAGGAVAADDPLRVQAGAVVEFGDDEVLRGPVLLGQSGQADTPVRHDVELGQAVAQRSLDLGLGDHHRRRGGVHPGIAELQRDQRAVTEVVRDPHGPQRLVRQRTEGAEPAEHLRAAGVQEVRPRRGGRSGGAVHDAHRDAVQAQRAGQRQSRRSGAHHQDLGVGHAVDNNGTVP